MSNQDNNSNEREEQDYMSDPVGKYLFGSKPNYIKAAIELKEIMDRHSRYSENWQVSQAKGEVSRQAGSLLKLLEDGGSPKKSDLQDLRAKIKNYGLACIEASRKSPEEQQYYRELEDQRWREDHTNYWTGEPCPRGPC